jgi:glycine C-acetyltransferase/8-amino-7-oxononanoate synthase
MVDEAHATGAIGPGGRGSVSAAGLSGEVDVVVGTLGKALGSYGAYACATAETIDFLVNTARPFIFSTAPPPPAVGAALAALALLEAEPELVDQLQANARQLRTALAAEGLGVGAAKTQVVPVHVGEAETAMDLCEAALMRGVFAQGIRPPTVPEDACRLRCTVMATHNRDELSGAARQIAAAGREVGLLVTQPLAA